MTDQNQLAVEGVEADQSIDPAADQQVNANENDNSADTDQAKAASDDLPIPKKILNAMSHKDRRIGKLTARQYEAENTIRQLQEQLAKHQPKENQSSAPETGKFDNYEDYLKALAEHKVNEKFTESEKKRQSEQTQFQQQRYQQERVAHLEKNDDAARSAFPDFESVFKDNEHIVMEAPEHVKRAFLEAENPAFAFYSLAKEGKLEDMFNMSPYQAVAMIARHEDKALALSKQKQVSKAPPPMAPSKGSSVGSKSVESLSGDDLLKWVHSK